MSLARLAIGPIYMGSPKSTLLDIIKHITLFLDQTTYRETDLIVFPQFSVMASSPITDTPHFQELLSALSTSKINIIISISQTDTCCNQIYTYRTGKLLLWNKNSLSFQNKENARSNNHSKLDHGCSKVLEIHSSYDNKLKFSVGSSLGIDNVNPLHTFWLASQHESIHISWFSNDDETRLSTKSSDTRLRYSASCFAQKAQVFYLLFLPFSISVYKPDGSKWYDIPNNLPQLHNINVELDLILYQKHLIDIVGHSSRPDLLSLSVDLHI